MSTLNTSYLAIDFLHADVEKAKACADILAHGGLEYSFANRADINAAIDGIYALENVTLEEEPQRSVSLIVKTRHAGKPIDPDTLRPEFNRIGRDMLQYKNWQTGSIIRIARLAKHGADIFDKLEEAGKDSVTIPVWRDEGHDIKSSGERKPLRALNDNLFSLNTSKAEPHWVGHIDDWSIANAAHHNPILRVKPENLRLMTLTKI